MGDMEQSPEVKENIPVQVNTPAPTTPTAEEVVKTLQAQLLEKEKSYKGLQNTLNKTNEELRKQADLRGELSTIKEQQKLLAAIVAQQQRVEENLDNIPQGKKQDLLKDFDRIAQEQETKRKQAETEIQKQEYFKQADEIYAKAKALGLADDDENLMDIEDFLKAGNLRRAEVKLKKLEGSVKPKEEPKKETEDEMKARIRAEILKEFKPDSAVPSGRTGGNEEIIKRYAAGDPTVAEDDYLKATGRR